MGTETVYIASGASSSALVIVKLNNPLMGTETLIIHHNYY